MKVRQPSKYYIGILKDMDRIGNDKVKTTWIFYVFETSFFLDYTFCIMITKKSVQT